MRTLALLLLAVATYAQPAYEIRGVVAEPSGSPIPSATVTIGGVDKANLTVQTDAAGAFRVALPEPGMYLATAKKDGYFLNSALGAPIVLDSARPQAATTITLAHAAEIVGRMVDDETRQPVASARVYLVARRWTRGRLRLERASPNAFVLTDAQGEFRFTGLPPNTEYLVTPRGIPTPADLLLATFSDSEINAQDEAYVTSYWPGGGADAAMATPVPIGSDGFSNIGTIYVRKTRQYRAHVTLGACDGSVKLALLQLSAMAVDLGVFPCGSALLLRGLDSGGYTLYASPNPGGRGIPDALYWGSAPLPVVDRTTKLRLPLRRGTVVEGRIVIPESVRQPTVAPTLRLYPQDTSLVVEQQPESFLQWNEDQRSFRLAVSPLASRLQVDPFGGELYVRQVVWNGIPTNNVYISSGTPVRTLEIHLDDKFATLNVTVTDGSRPANALLFPVREGSAPGLSRVASNGQATIPRLPPGNYRILAVPPGVANLDPPGVYDRLYRSAPRVTLQPGATQPIDVRLSDVR